jgi:hypothetical protein
MLHDLPDFHADRSGDLFEIGLLVRGHRRTGFSDAVRVDYFICSQGVRRDSNRHAAKFVGGSCRGSVRLYS